MTSTSGIYPNIDLNPTQVFDISPNYIEAMDKARFVRTFGIAALAFSLLTVFNIMWLNLAVSIGIGSFVMWHDHENYYRALGIVVLVAGSVFIPSLGPLVFSFAVFWKGREVLATLVEEQRSVEDWPLTFRRARVGTIASAVGLGINCLMIVLSIALILVRLIAAES